MSVRLKGNRWRGSWKTASLNNVLMHAKRKLKNLITHYWNFKWNVNEIFKLNDGPGRNDFYSISQRMLFYIRWCTTACIEIKDIRNTCYSSYGVTKQMTEIGIQFYHRSTVENDVQILSFETCYGSLETKTSRLSAKVSIESKLISRSSLDPKQAYVILV